MYVVPMNENEIFILYNIYENKTISVYIYIYIYVYAAYAHISQLLFPLLNSALSLSPLCLLFCSVLYSCCYSDGRSLISQLLVDYM